MKLEQLTEAPLPDDWDKEVYNEKISFAQRVRYAQERARKLGAGSARVAFEIEYQGRLTVLKVAKNRKGAAQNEVESQMLEDWHLKSYDIVIPLIDYDEENSYPTWIHTERARKANDSDFKRFCGGTLEEVCIAALYYSGQAYQYWFAKNVKEEDLKVDSENDTVQGLIQIFGNYGMPAGDIMRLSSWGIYKNAPVLVDVGLSQDVYRDHYSR